MRVLCRSQHPRQTLHLAPEVLCSDSSGRWRSVLIETMMSTTQSTRMRIDAVVEMFSRRFRLEPHCVTAYISADYFDTSPASARYGRPGTQSHRLRAAELRQNFKRQHCAIIHSNPPASTSFTPLQSVSKRCCRFPSGYYTPAPVHDQLRPVSWLDLDSFGDDRGSQD
nr:hypothetical protein CFP56_70387 [Quercus suber]